MKRVLMIVAVVCALSFFLIGGTVHAGCVMPPAGLVSWWSGDGHTYDVVNLNRSYLQGGASFGNGLIDQAFSLDGVDDFVMVPHDSSLNFGTNDFTVDLWVNFRTIAGEQVIIEKFIETHPILTGIPREGWTLTKLDNQTIRFSGDPWTQSSSIIDAAPSSIPINTWIYVAVTRSGNTFTLYWNGIPIGSGESSVGLNSTSSLKFGHRGIPNDTPGSVNSSGYYLNGLIDEVEIYNRALTATEIQSIYIAGSDGKCKSDITGCISLQGVPLSNTLVTLQQKKTTDVNGCYEFFNAASRKDFKVIINGPVVP
jgi:hypothetical protein